jgi:hypothetical protein
MITVTEQLAPMERRPTSFSADARLLVMRFSDYRTEPLFLERDKRSHDALVTARLAAFDHFVPYYIVFNNARSAKALDGSGGLAPGVSFYFEPSVPLVPFGDAANEHNRSFATHRQEAPKTRPAKWGSPEPQAPAGLIRA